MNHHYPQIIGIFMAAAGVLLLSSTHWDPNRVTDKEGKESQSTQVDPASVCRSELVSRRKAGEELLANPKTVVYDTANGFCVAEGDGRQMHWRSPNIRI